MNLLAPNVCGTCGALLTDSISAGRCPACLIADAMTSAADEMLGEFGGHELVEELARGGMGVVYRARQIEPQREVALKAVLGGWLSSTEARERFRQEARAMASLEHPAILPVYQFGEEDGVPYFTMKLAVGGTLAERIPTFAGEWRRIAELIVTVASAVQFAHDRGVLHRDLKPGNILFDHKDQGFVSDFGLAKLLDDSSNITLSAALLGTPHYLAPEIAAQSSTATTASDIWSLGVILYELLAQRKPFDAPSVPGLLREITEKSPSPMPDAAPSDLRVIALKALSREPSRRYGSARELMDDLQRWLDGRPILARPVHGLEKGWLWARRNPTVTTLTLLLVLGAILSGLVLLATNRRLADALQGSEKAHKASDSQLRRALFLEAEAVLHVDAISSRKRALDIITQLSGIEPASMEMRSLAVRALSLLGASRSGDFPAGFLNMGSSLDHTQDLSQYATGRDATPGFQIFSTQHGSPPLLVDAEAAGYSTRYSRDDKWLAVRLRNRKVIVRRTAEPAKPLFEITNTGYNWDIPVDFDPSGGYWLYSSGDPKVRKHLSTASTNANDEVIITCPAAVHGLTFSPDGNRVAVKWDGGWGVWDVSSASLIWQRAGDLNPVHPIWSPNGKSVGSGPLNQPGYQLVNAETGEEEINFMGHLGPVAVAAFHPARPIVATIGWDRQLLVWDASTGQSLGRHAAYSRGVKFSADGSKIAFSPDLWGTSVFELALPDVWRQWDARPYGWAEAIHLDVSGDGRWLVTESSAGLLRLWDVARRCIIAELKRTENVAAVSGPTFWRNESTLVEGGGTGQGGVIRLSTVMSTGSKPPHILSVDPLPAGKPGARTADRRSVILNANDGSAVVVNDDGTVRMNVPAWGQSRVLDISPDDQWAACQGKSYEVRRIKDGQRVCTIGSRDTAQLRFSPDGKYLAISTRVATFVYGTDVWKELARWPVALTSEKVGHTDFSPDGKLLAGCAEPGVITLRETRRWTPLIQLQTPGSPSQRSGTFRMAWTPDGSRLIVLSVAQRVIDWDIQRLRAELAKLHLDWE